MCPTNSVEERWNIIRDAIFNSAMEAKSRLIWSWNHYSETSARSSKALIDYKRIRERSETMHNGSFGAAQTITGLTLTKASNFLLTSVISVPYVMAWKKAFGPCITKVARQETSSQIEERRLRDGFHTIRRFTQRKTLSAMQQLRIPTLVLIMQELDATPFIRELERAII